MSDNEAEVLPEVFEDLKIDSHDCLQGIKRSKCPKCNSSRMYFCYTCYVYTSDDLQKNMPNVKLPFKIDIIKHAKELDGKSTAIHAAMIAQGDVKIYTYPSIPDYTNQSNIIMVFPDKKSQTLDEIIKVGFVPGEKTKSNDLFNKVVFIDSTWNQVHGIITDERLKNLPKVKLNSMKTTYWRSQHNCPDTYLATIEAIHLFLKEYHLKFHSDYTGEYDNLLYFYVFFYKMVHKK